MKTICTLLQSVCDKHNILISIEAHDNYHVSGEYCKSTDKTKKLKDYKKLVKDIQAHLPFDYNVFLEHQYDKDYGKIHIEVV